jgi:hypothetical protein
MTNPDLWPEIGGWSPLRLALTEKVSIFVADTDKDAIFNKLKKNFLEANVAYLSRKSFGPRFVMKKYHEPKAPGAGTLQQSAEVRERSGNTPATE